MSKLFSPIALGAVRVPNRIVKSAMVEGFADRSGKAGPEMAALYQRWARGGVGLSISGMVTVQRGHALTDSEVGLYEDRHIPALREVAAAAKGAGGRFFVQLGHAPPQILRRTARALGGSVSISAGFNRVNFLIDRSLRVDELEAIAASFGAAARRAREAGADGVQLHGAHGYLLSRSISPRHNRRRDAFGGDFERRLELLRRVYGAVRSAVGQDFPVIIKLNAHDGRRDGLQVEDAIEIGRRLQRWGIDAIEISAGTGDEGLGFYPNRGEIPVELAKRFLAREMPFMRPALPALGAVIRRVSKGVALHEEAYFLPIALRFARALEIPVIAVGGFRSRRVAERAIEEGVAMVALARPLVAQPDLPRQWREGRAATATCTSCNRCFVQVGLGEPLRCTGFRGD